MNVSSAGVITGKQATMVGGQAYTGVMLVANNMGSSFEPITVLFMESIASIAAKFFPEQLGKYTGVLGMVNNNVICVLVIVLFVLVKFSRSNAATKIPGLVAEDFENKLGVCTAVVLPLIYYAMELGSKVNAATLDTEAIVQGVGTVATGFGIVFLAILLLVVYYVVRTVVFAFEIAMIPFSIVSGSSLFVELAKSLIAVLLVVFTLALPGLMVCMFGAFFVACLFVFKYAYVAVRYFKSIYVMPLFKKKKTDLIDVKKADKFLQGDMRNEAKIFVQTFSHTKLTKEIGLYDKCYFYSNGPQMMLCKQKFMSQKLDWYDMSQWKEMGTVFIKKSKRFIELFVLKPEDEAKIASILPRKKQTHIIISREYSNLFEQMSEILQLKDYTVYQKSLREEAKRQRQEAWQQRQDEMKEKLEEQKAKMTEKKDQIKEKTAQKSQEFKEKSAEKKEQFMEKTAEKREQFKEKSAEVAGMTKDMLNQATTDIGTMAGELGEKAEDLGKKMFK